MLRRNPIRATYEWVLSWAEHPSGHWALAGISFAESSFFPIPPDVLLIPMCLSRPRRAWWFASLCTAASVIGGLLGYVIGMWFFRGIGARIIAFYNVTDNFAWLGEQYAANAFLVIAGVGFTPIPYKVFTIAAGFFEVAVPTFVIASAVGRGGRFFLVAGLLHWFGEPMKEFIDRYFNLLTVALVALIAAGFIVLRFVFH